MTQQEALRLLESQREKCFLCGWILEDLAKNGKLTGHPLDAMGAGIFPVDGKRGHLALEAMSVDSRAFKPV